MAGTLAVLQEVSAGSSAVASWLTYVEDGIYLVTAGLLGVTAVVLIGTAKDPSRVDPGGTDDCDARRRSTRR